MVIDGSSSQGVGGGMKIAGPSPPIENRRCEMAYGSVYDYLLRTSGYPVIYDQVLIGDNTTVNQNLFSIVGVNQVFSIYGIVTTPLGNNITTVYLSIWDGTLNQAITLATGSAMSSAPAGSLVFKEEATSVVINYKTAVTGIYEEGTLDNSMQPFICGKKATAATFLRMTYTTTNTPTSGVIRWKIAYKPLSVDGVILAV